MRSKCRALTRVPHALPVQRFGGDDPAQVDAVCLRMAAIDDDPAFGPPARGGQPDAIPPSIEIFLKP